MQTQTAVLLVALIAAVVVCFVIVYHYDSQANNSKAAASEYMTMYHEQVAKNQAIIECIEQYEHTNSMPCAYDWHYE